MQRRDKKSFSPAHFRRLWEKGVTCVEIGKAIDRATSTVPDIAKSLGLPGRSGQGAPRKVSDIPAFTDMWKRNVSLTDMAGHFKCDPVTIRNTAARLGLARRPRGRLYQIRLKDYQAMTFGERRDAARAAR